MCNPFVSGQAARLAFTLAEVLITLGIIGVAASLTMPSLIQKHKEKELITRTKRVYSVIQNAVLMAQKENDTIGDNTFLFDTSKTSAEVASNFAKYFNGAKVCVSNSKDCSNYYYSVKFATRRKDDTSGTTIATNLPTARIITNDGAIIFINQMTSCERTSTDCKRDADYNCIKDENGKTTDVIQTSYNCAFIDFDVNGPKPPNQFGQDVYELSVNVDKIVPNLSNLPGGKSFKNILTGIDKLEYTKYNVGESD